MVRFSSSTFRIISILFVLILGSASYSYAASNISPQVSPQVAPQDKSPYDDSEVTSAASSHQESAEIALANPLSATFAQGGDIDEIDVLISRIKQIAADDPNLVVILPISGVLFIPTDKEFFIRDSNYKSLWQKALSATRESKLDYIEEITLIKYEHQAVDERIIKFVSEMIYKGIKVIIVTPNVSGKFNDIPYLEEWTAEWLKERGIDLNKSTYRETKFVMDKYSSKRNGSYSTFYKGLLSCSTDKEYNAAHSVIMSFFVTMGQKPTTIVMIDNNRDIRNITEQNLKNINDAVLFFGYDIIDTLRKIRPEDYSSEVTPKSYLDFWKKFGKQLNAVTRNSRTKSDHGNPYEEDL